MGRPENSRTNSQSSWLLVLGKKLPSISDDRFKKRGEALESWAQRKNDTLRTFTKRERERRNPLYLRGKGGWNRISDTLSRAGHKISKKKSFYALENTDPCFPTGPSENRSGMVA